MADDKYDSLLAIRNQSAQQAALRQIANQAQAEVDDYHRYIAEGDTDKAAWAQRGYAALAQEYNAMLAAMGAAQQQAQPQQQAPQAQPQQQQQPQRPQLTPTQQQILERYPGIRNDARKWQEAQYWDASLRMQGYDPNSERYAQAMLVGLGVLDANGQQESNEIASPDTMVEAVRNSKYAKDFTREQYDQLANYRDELKKAGFLRMDENQ
jgi:hypothetical protein